MGLFMQVEAEDDTNTIIKKLRDTCNAFEKRNGKPSDPQNIFGFNPNEVIMSTSIMLKFSPISYISKNDYERSIEVLTLLIEQLDLFRKDIRNKSLLPEQLAIVGSLWIIYLICQGNPDATEDSAAIFEYATSSYKNYGVGSCMDVHKDTTAYRNFMKYSGSFSVPNPDIFEKAINPVSDMRNAVEILLNTNPSLVLKEPLSYAKKVRRVVIQFAILILLCWKQWRPEICKEFGNVVMALSAQISRIKAEKMNSYRSIN